MNYCQRPWFSLAPRTPSTLSNFVQNLLTRQNLDFEDLQHVCNFTKINTPTSTKTITNFTYSIMGQTTSSEGTLYPSPGHERTAILESLRFLRKRVKKIGESESPLLVLVIRKHEARLKDLEDASQVSARVK